MSKGLVAKEEIEISADVSKVWDALINPELIKRYLFGTQAISDWKIGSTIIFRGEWEGNAYEDKGLILKLDVNKIFQYAYWTSFSELEDKPENYVNITYELIERDRKTILTITQDKIETEEASDMTSKNWKVVLKGIKEIVEKSVNN
ncbi:SRPBCC domain-containing protein [Clostridium estertheticum]|uniref:SRPBCC family protein n=1 Tax=Clostridium estertheticum TaxID=238834 RepID=UPI001C7D1B37|nr:SRPBCC family protein [Clostridium estertheticum]MBX4258620.1 SRPBCC domain-containing protein [Clostridium estertheticum]WLC69907.1 SRPBCC domain-containing protein [Clostridium estertheticum]